MQSFKALQYGVKLYDRFRNESFIYKAHITHILGDTPAISKMMGIKGVNSEFPCRNCKIQCQRGPSNTFYPALHPPDEHATHNVTYNSLRLPLWESNHFKVVADAVDEGREWVSHHTGIKIKSPLMELSSIKPPWSFCIDFMHLILENIVASMWKGLLGKTSNEFGDVSKHGNDILSKEVVSQIESEMKVGLNLSNIFYNNINKITKENKNNLPSSLSRNVVDIKGESGKLTAKHYCDLLVLYFPIILKDRVSNRRYQLMINLRWIWLKIIKKSISLEDINELKRKCNEFVLEYEE